MGGAGGLPSTAPSRTHGSADLNMCLAEVEEELRISCQSEAFSRPKIVAPSGSRHEQRNFKDKS